MRAVCVQTVLWRDVHWICRIMDKHVTVPDIVLQGLTCLRWLITDVPRNHPVILQNLSFIIRATDMHVGNEDIVTAFVAIMSWLVLKGRSPLLQKSPELCDLLSRILETYSSTSPFINEWAVKCLSGLS